MALADNLVSYWPLDEASGNALDAHGLNTATETSGTIDAAAGKVGGARDFEAGDTEYFVVADNADLSAGDTDFTVAFWVKPESTANQAWLSKWNTAGNQREYACYYSASAIQWIVSSNGAATANVSSGTAVSAGTWYFVVCWHDSVNNQIGIAINAGTPATTSTSAGVFNGTAEFRIGEAFGSYADGLIDEVAFWRRVLSSAERTELYNGGSGRNYAYIIGGGGGGGTPVGADASYHYREHIGRGAA